MPWYDKRSGVQEQSEVISYDDGGTGLFDACTARFAKLGWTVACDSYHAVWLTSANGSYSIGLAPWLLRFYPMDKVLDDAEVKMRGTGRGL